MTRSKIQELVGSLRHPRILFLLSLFVATSAENLRASDEDQRLIESAQLTPMVVRMGGEAFSYEIKVTDPTITQLEIIGGDELCLFTFSHFGFSYNKSSLILLDDGHNGDLQAGDMTFTLGGLTVPDLSDSYTAVWNTKAASETWNSSREQLVKISFANGSQIESSIHVDAACGALSMGVPIPTIVDLDGDDRATENVLSLTIPVTDLPYPYYTDLGVRYSQDVIIEKAVKYLKGDYNWIFVQDFSGQSNVYWPRSRPWTGVSEFPFEAFGGAPDWLLGMLYDQSGWASAVGSNVGSQPFGGDYNTTNHELLHTWASFLPSELSISNGAGHYGVMIEETSCFNGNGNHTYLSYSFDAAAGAVTVPIEGRGNRCSDFELYLMGLLPSAQVKPITVVVNPGQLQIDGANIVYPADGIREVTIEDIISLIGEREPLPVEPKPEFKAVMVLVHDRKLTDTEIALFDYRMKDMAKAQSEHGMTFQEAVFDRATLSTEIALEGITINSQTDWPGQFNGTTPSSSLNLAFNNIGVFNLADQLIYACLRISENGIASSLADVEKFDVAFEMASTENGTIRIVRTRLFNAGGALNDSGEEPSCSGSFDTASGVYKDIIQAGDLTLSVTFELINSANVELKLLSAIELKP